MGCAQPSACATSSLPRQRLQLELGLLPGALIAVSQPSLPQCAAGPTSHESDAESHPGPRLHSFCLVKVAELLWRRQGCRMLLTNLTGD